ncbi:MAG: diguanylate cyclase [Actinobacteria bacterium]|nr:diguanylate cyclase [Actinomycetota bacterium]
MTGGSPLEQLRSEVGAITAEWRAACAPEDLQPLGGDPLDRSMVLAIVAALGHDDPSSPPRRDFDRVADALVDAEVGVEVVIRQLSCLREVLQSRMTRELPPDDLPEGLRRLNAAIDGFAARCASKTARRLEDAAFLDPLTGLLNRRALERDLARELAQVHRGSRRLSLVMSDLDGLKEINDRQGHAAGDRALCRLADSICAALRGGDSAYRLGGDEFVVLLPDTPLEGVPAVVQRISESSPPLFSWGAAAATGQDTAESLLDAADRHLLERRRAAGRSHPRPRVAAPAAPPAEQRWHGRPGLAAALRAVAFALPLVASLAAGWGLSAVLPRPSTVAATLVWWTTVLAAAGFALVVFDRLARRVLPLAALLRLSMVFPDRAPSRLGVALRSGSTKVLRDRAVEELREGHQEPAVAARTILTLAASLNTHDRGTRGHSERVRAYADLIAEEMGLDEEARDRLRWAALLHDVGKLSVPSSTLNSHHALTEDDWEILRRHPLEGALLAAPLVEWLGPWATAIEQHHERFDGTGYPYGLAGQELSLAARIVAVADSYDAMTSVRSYSAGISPAEARAELARQAGSHFDPTVVRAFLNVALGRLRWVMGPLAFISAMPVLAALGMARKAVDTVGRTVALGGVSLISTVGLVHVTEAPVPPASPPAVAQQKARPPARPPSSQGATLEELTPVEGAVVGEEATDGTEVAGAEAVEADELADAVTTTDPPRRGGTPAGAGRDGAAAPTTTRAPDTASTAPPPSKDEPPAQVEPQCGQAGGKACRYSFDGFFSPVSNTETNWVTAGAAVPFKWRLTDAQGNTVTTLSSVRSATFSGDEVEYQLSYNADKDHFMLVAKTDRAWAGTEKTFTLTLDDGSVHEAVFRFTRSTSDPDSDPPTGGDRDRRD